MPRRNHPVRKPRPTASYFQPPKSQYWGEYAPYANTNITRPLVIRSFRQARDVIDRTFNHGNQAHKPSVSLTYQGACLKLIGRGAMRDLADNSSLKSTEIIPAIINETQRSDTFPIGLKIHSGSLFFSMGAPKNDNFVISGTVEEVTQFNNAPYDILDEQHRLAEIILGGKRLASTGLILEPPALRIGAVKIYDKSIEPENVLEALRKTFPTDMVATELVFRKPKGLPY